MAATGVGAGDLATGALAGSHLGVAVLWAVVLGAVLKLALNEALARWQLATGQTILEGALGRLGGAARWVFLLYLLPWSWFVGTALIAAAGITTHALAPIVEDPQDAKLLLGGTASLGALALVQLGGYRVFERAMRVLIAAMFVTVVVSAALVAGSWADILTGLVTPRLPDTPDALTWAVALAGGVGGTLTIVCYGYWMREDGLEGEEALPRCRADLVVGYAATAMFGAAMVVIGSRVRVEGGGAGLLVALGDRLAADVGEGGRWLFLCGAWAAVISSLLGVWQSVPYVFADFWRIVRASRDPVDVTAPAYRVYGIALATIPLAGLAHPFRTIQKAYAVLGAAFLPLLALALLVLCNRRRWMGPRMQNGPLSNAMLAAALALTAAAGFLRLRG